MQPPRDGQVGPANKAGAAVSEHRHGDTVVVAVSGAVDMLTAPLLAQQVQTSLAARPPALIVDLTDVDFLATAGMEVLINAHRAAEPTTKFAVAADGPATSRPLKITGLTELISLYASLEEALEQVAA